MTLKTFKVVVSFALKVVISFPLGIFSPGLSERKSEVTRKYFRPLCSKQWHETVRKQGK